MTEDDWINRYEPIPHPKGAAHGFEIDGQCCLIDGDEEEILNKIPEKHLWTLLENNEGDLYIAAGFHRVNRVGHLNTRFPWKTGRETTEAEGVDIGPEDQ